MHERDLPLLWHQWANSFKRQEINVLRDVLEAFTRTPDAFSTIAPVVSSKLVQDLLQFYLAADTVDDLQSGL
jgi:hypothetical protein